MPFLDPLHPLQSSILELLAVSPGLTMPLLREKLEKECSIDVSLQNLYRTIAQLIDNHLLIREKGKLSINMVWAAHVESFAAQVKRRYLDDAGSVLELPTENGGKREFFAESLGALDPTWNHVLRSILGMHKDAEWYEYNSHPYHLLAAADNERRLYGSMGNHGHKLYGNDGFLDRYGVNLNREGSQIVLAAQTPFPSEGYSLWVCGDYLVDCVFPEVLSKHFSFFFQSVQSIEQFHPELFADIFRMKARCRLHVWKSAKETALLRSKFTPFFPAQRGDHRPKNSGKISEGSGGRK